MRFIVLLLVVFVTRSLHAQSNDSLYYQLQEVEVTAVTNETILRLPSSESIIGRSQLDQQPSYSMLPAVNTVPGVRMEERSPGSYRLSIRGSLLRSPFGVRNVKIYMGDFPFTDAGGNTYLNSLDIAALGSLRILKGPEASVFGANTGGVLLIDPVIKTGDSMRIATELSGGSYGLFHENASLQLKGKKTTFHFSEAYQRSDGYRENSAMQRLYLQTGGTWRYGQKTAFKLLLLFSDMNYQTPGGLTQTQYNNDPQKARHATTALPGAVQQKAGIFNRTAFGGLSHDFNFTKNFRHVISVFGSYTEFKNPFITNYEERMEATYGARTYVEASTGNSEQFKLLWNLGGEWQQTNSQIDNFGNNLGKKDTMQASDHIYAQQAFAFTRLLADVKQRLLLEVSASYNFFSYRYRNLYPSKETDFNRKNFTPQFMPRAALSYKLTSNIAWRASASGGYSSPTIAEVRSSDNNVNTALQAEKGINYETGFRIRDNRDYCWIDVSGFYYKLSNAIVRRVNAGGNEYFINAGGTKQPGLEGQASVWLLKFNTRRFVRFLQLKGAITYNHFSFLRYQAGTEDYSGNGLTGVPRYTSMESLSLGLPAFFELYLQYYYSGKIPLNDANSVYAAAYHLMQLKLQWEKTIGKFSLGVFAGADNLLNQKYSLGNDLNAVGGRYFNAASPRNYYAGIRASF